MDLLINLSIGALLCIALVKSAELLIKSTSSLAKYFKISEYTISFLIIAFATSLPELLVGVISAIDNRPMLSYGNVLGSNIANLTLILAIPILVGGTLKTREIIKNKDVFFTVFFGVLPLILILDGLLSQVDGFVLILSYFFYLILVFKRSSVIKNVLQNISHIKVWKEILMFVFSIGLLLVSANFLVKIAENISYIAKVPLILVGLTVTALGTSLPELVFGLKAIKTNHKGEVLGNIVGSVIANSTLVLGLTSVISPISRDGNIGLSSTCFLVFTLIVFLIFSLKNKDLEKREAVLLIAIYVIFVMVEKILA